MNESVLALVDFHGFLGNHSTCMYSCLQETSSMEQSCFQPILLAGWQMLRKCSKGVTWKVWTQTKIPHKTLFYRDNVPMYFQLRTKTTFFLLRVREVFKNIRKFLMAFAMKGGASRAITVFSCPGQLNRWPCHWVSEWVRDFWFQRLQSITMTSIGDLVTHSVSRH